MSNIVPFGQSQVPAYIGQVGMTPEQIKAMNAAAAIGTGGGGVDRISIKGSRFRLVLGGVAQAPLPFVELDVAILRVNDGINKTYFAADWNPDADAGPPDCSSDDGISPRGDSPNKQSAACANCPKNEWGSHINPTTGAKGKACQDSKRMAVMAPGGDGRYASPTDMYQLAVPPASLKDFGMLVKGLAAHTPPAAYNMVVVTLSFDPDASFPKLNFKPRRWLEQDEFAVVNTRYNDEETKRICGLAEAQGLVLGSQATTQAAPQIQQQPVQQAVQHQQPVQQAQPVVQEQAAATGWGGQPAQPITQQQPVTQQGWGGQQTHPVPQTQPVQQVAQGWGGEQAQPVQQTQQVQQNVQQQQPVTQQAPQRQRGKPSEGRARRTKEEIAEDANADALDAAMQQGNVQQAQPVTQQAASGWGGQIQPVATQQQAQPVVQEQAAAGWGGQPAQQTQQAQPVQQAAASGWGGQAQPVTQTTGAPLQPGVMNDAAMAFAGWDDAQ